MQAAEAVSLGTAAYEERTGSGIQRRAREGLRSPLRRHALPVLREEQWHWIQEHVARRQEHRGGNVTLVLLEADSADDVLGPVGVTIGPGILVGKAYAQTRLPEPYPTPGIAARDNPIQQDQQSPFVGSSQQLGDPQIDQGAPLLASVCPVRKPCSRRPPVRRYDPILWEPPRNSVSELRRRCTTGTKNHKGKPMCRPPGHSRLKLVARQCRPRESPQPRPRRGHRTYFRRL